MNVVAYARYSSDNQRDASIDAQLRFIEEYARRHDMTITEVYTDRALTATSDKRPAFLRMIRDAQLGTFSAILVHKFDRFSRNRYDFAVYRHELERCGVRLIAVAQDFGQSVEAELMEGLMQEWAAYYSRNLSNEVKKGHRENALAALHNGGYAPFGYRVGADQRLELDPQRAPYVRRIFDACLQGLSYRPILEELAAAGIRGARGAVMRYSSIYEILTNERYTGTYVYSTQPHARRDKSQALRIPNAHPAIITPAEFEEVQKIMESRKHAGAPAKRTYICSGLVYCACGAPMHANTATRKGHTYSRYLCAGRCGAPSVLVSVVDGAAFAYLRQLLSEDTKAAFTRALDDYVRSRRSHAQKKSASVKKDVAALQKQIDALVANMSTGVLPAEALAVMGQRIADLKSQIDVLNLSVTMPDLPDRQAIPDEIRRYLDACAAVDFTTDPQEAASAVHTYISRLCIKKDRIEISSTFAAVAQKYGRGDRIPGIPATLYGSSFPREIVQPQPTKVQKFK